MASFGACIERRRRLDRVIFRVHSLPSDPFSLGGPTREQRTRDRDLHAMHCCRVPGTGIERFTTGGREKLRHLRLKSCFSAVQVTAHSQIRSEIAEPAKTRAADHSCENTNVSKLRVETRVPAAERAVSPDGVVVQLKERQRHELHVLRNSQDLCGWTMRVSTMSGVGARA